MAQAITVKAPKEIFNLKDFQRDLLAVLNDTADEAVTLFKSSFKHWRHKPQVHKKIAKSARYNIAKIWIEDAQYARVNYGTKQHRVGLGGVLMRFSGYNLKIHRAVKTGLGANRYIYKPKTSPDRIESAPGFPAVGTETIIRHGSWMVSGITPRRFDKQIANAIRPEFIKNTNKVIARAAKGKK